MSPTIGRVRGAPRRVSRFCASVLLLLAIGIGLPAVALETARRRFGSANPLSGVDPPWSWSVGDALSAPLADGTVVDALIRVSVIIVFAASLIIVVTTIMEIVHLVRDGGLHRPRPTGLGWATALGRYIAIGLLVVVPLASPKVAVASATPAVMNLASDAHPVVTATALDNGVVETFGHSASIGSSGAPLSGQASAEPQRYVVQRGDSVWSIAAALTDGDNEATLNVAERILDTNLQRTMNDGRRFTNPALIDIGWELMIPADVGGLAPSSQTADSEDGADAFPLDGATSNDRYVVAPGDNLWDIAASHLGDGNAWTAIWDMNGGDTMVDGRTFDDPDLLVAGWILELPARTASSPAGPAADPAVVGLDPTPAHADASSGADADRVADPTDTPSAGHEAAPEVEINEAPNRVPQAEPPPDQPVEPEEVGTSSSPGHESQRGPRTPDTTPTPAVSASAAADSSDRASATPTPAASTTTSSVATVDVGADAGAATDAPSTGSTSPLRLEHAAILATGIVALVGVRRRARLRAATPHSRMPKSHEAHAATERRLRVSDPGERLMRVDIGVRAIAAALPDDDVRIGWIELSADGDLRAQLTGDAALANPWVGDRSRWTLDAAIPIELLAQQARQSNMPCSALVHIGVTDDGADLLLDVEACGQLSVDGPAAATESILNAVAVGLASSTYAEVANLITVGLPESALLHHRNAHCVADLPSAVNRAAAMAPHLPDGRSTFGLRARRTGGEVWEPTIIVVGGDHGTCALDTPPPGVAIVIAQPTKAGDERRPDEISSASAQLSQTERGWELRAFGSHRSVVPTGVTANDLADVSALLNHCATPTDEPSDLDDLEPQWHDATPTDDATDIELDHAIVVGLLGPLTITDDTGTPATFERSKTVELIAWLATHRERSTRSGGRSALWEIDVRDSTFANVVSEARRGLARLSAPPKDSEWIPRTLSDELPLDTRVVTDAALIEHRLRHARVQPPHQAVETLRPAVERVRGIPFSGTNYLWPEAEGISSQLILLAITAASELAGHALSLGDTELVFWATGRGLAVLPGHEELVGLRMRAYARTGDLAGVRSEWELYEQVVTADPWSDGEPAEKLVELRRELLGSPSS
ncbi:MAG: LysM peptidoglycan-binding domain-containing protein [Ilumatobacteraceae bacterium]|nr:LysM peptidoglycan-binding domain-containing protein [Ilumatobacteraceae bacterium]